READRPDDAIPLYERALQVEPDGNAFKGLAEALWDRGDVARAVAVLRDGIARHPRNVENLVRLGVILASGGDLPAAVGGCRQALEIRPGTPPALVELALTLRAKLPEEDRLALEQALQQPVGDAAHAAERFGLAQVADARGDFAAAAAHLEIANALMKQHNAER